MRGLRRCPSFAATMSISNESAKSAIGSIVTELLEIPGVDVISAEAVMRSSSSMPNSPKFEELSAECICHTTPAEPVFSDLANYGLVHDRFVEVQLGVTSRFFRRCARFECEKTASEEVSGVQLCPIHAPQYAAQVKADFVPKCPDCGEQGYEPQSDGYASCENCGYEWFLPYELHSAGCDCDLHWYPCPNCDFEETVYNPGAKTMTNFFCPECEHEWSV